MIENYLGFPNGISGSELATRAMVQARRFGAELLLARPVTGLSAAGPGYIAGLSDGTLIRGRAVLVASGVEWRRLDVPGVDDLLGAGVYYGAGPSEALACTGSRVVVVGGGNSAGQAVVRFSRYAKQVTLLVRGPDLGASMSQYLIDHVTAIPNVDVRVRTEVVGLEGDDRLRAVIASSEDSTEPVPLPADAMFICIGGTPRTAGTEGINGALGGFAFVFIPALEIVAWYSPVAAGSALVPITVVTVLLSGASGRLAQRIGSRPPLVAGCLLCAVASMLAARLGSHASYWTVVFRWPCCSALGWRLSFHP